MKAIIVLFKTTCEAMKMRSVAERLGLPGRIIPTPQKLSAGCGMAWMAPEACDGQLMEALGDNDIQPESVVRMEYQSRWNL